MKNFLTNHWHNILAIALLLFAVGNHPYGYYQIMRWVVTITAFYNAYKFSETHLDGWKWVFIAVGILFNPIFPVYLDKSTWAPIDIVVASIFIASLTTKIWKK
jgi:hypothetical protein